MMHIGYYDSKLGKIEIKEENQKIVSVQFVEQTKVESNSSVTEKLKMELDEYFKGKRKYFDVDLCPIGTDFQKRVWNLLINIPYGEVVTYKEIACQLGNVRLTRAVANAIGKNPLLILIPCHRVIGNNGSLTGYRGGLERKKRLLALEK